MASRDLGEYRRKRDPAATPEPFGDPAPPGGSRFVVHKHSARRLHYDLRLELDGVYKSWAVPKGPSLDPHDKRLAVHVEDHPLEYGKFEGTIPQGEYGGGAVVLWDRGRWVPEEDDPEAGYRSGKLKFHLDGEIYPVEQPTWNSAAVVLAANALGGTGPTAGLFRGEGLPTGLTPEELIAAGEDIEAERVERVARDRNA